MKPFLLALICFCASLQAQDRYTLSGTVRDTNSNESLIGVNILVPGLGTGTITNEYGFYSITLPKGSYEVVLQALGFETKSTRIILDKNIKLNFSLSEEAELLDEIVLTERSDQLDLRSPQMGVNTLPVSTIQQVPVVLGEADVLKSLLLLPGVTNAGEGASGINVRGGAADQNLILLDEATIFNSSHLFGFFSVFNPDAIKDVKLYKGGIPARYGGRLSSVLEIYQKEGNSKSFHMKGGIGLVASRLLAEGPIVQDKASFLVGLRGSYAHFFLPLFDISNKAYFYDLNTKLNYRLDEKNNFLISGYFGRDVFSVADNFRNVYGNSVFNFRWNHVYSDRLFSNLSLIYSDYYYGLLLDFVGFEWNSGIQNFNIKYDFKNYISDKLQVNYGLNNIYYQFNPGKIAPNRADSGIVEEQLIQKYANELALYIEAEQDVSKALSLQYGIRFSHFTRLGQEELNVYANTPVNYNEAQLRYSEAMPVSTINPGRSATLATFTNWEPRLALAYSFSEKTSVKASYSRMVQYLHLLSNTNSPTPLDVWTPSGPFIQPQKLHLYSAGYFLEFAGGDYTLQVESFYKDIENRIDYIDGANLIANNAIEQVILNGNARAYGLELLVKKNYGNLKGWVAYTLSRSEQRTPGRKETESGINFGEWYNTPYDKTHDLSVYGSYDANAQWNFNANFSYQTGQPTNYPVGQFEFQELTVPYYGRRNQERLPDYHRLDLSATYKPRKNQGRQWQREWVFSIYNVYNRRNAASINFRENRDTGANEAVRTSIFGIVPAITYNFKF